MAEGQRSHREEQVPILGASPPEGGSAPPISRARCRCLPRRPVRIGEPSVRLRNGGCEAWPACCRSAKTTRGTFTTRVRSPVAVIRGPSGTANRVAGREVSERSPSRRRGRLTSLPPRWSGTRISAPISRRRVYCNLLLLCTASSSRQGIV